MREQSRPGSRLSGMQIRYYRCGDYWHYTSADADSSAFLRSRDADAGGGVR